MKRTGLSLVVASLVVLLLTPTPARAVDVRLEVGPLVVFPLFPLLDGLPLEVQDGLLTGERETYLMDFSQKPGFGVSFALLLNSWEFRYEFAAVDQARITHVQFPDYTGVLSLDILEFTKGVGIADEYDTMFFHYVGFGYRFTPWDWVVHPYFPFGLGFAAVQVRNGADPLLGFSIEIGAGVNWDALPYLRVGLCLRYHFSAYKLPNTAFDSIQSLGIQAAATNTSLTEAVMETLSSLSLSLHVSYKF